MHKPSRARGPVVLLEALGRVLRRMLPLSAPGRLLQVPLTVCDLADLPGGRQGNCEKRVRSQPGPSTADTQPVSRVPIGAAFRALASTASKLHGLRVWGFIGHRCGSPRC